MLGHADADELLTSVSSSARTIAWALESTMRRAGQSQRARVLRVGPRRPSMTPLGHGLFAHDGEAVLGTTRLVGVDPTLPLRAGVVAARHRLPLAPQTLTNLADCPDLPTPWDEQARDLLSDLLAAGPGLEAVWEGLDQVGVVERWLPEWAAVRCRPQHNPVHRHTVDRHLIETGYACRAETPLAGNDLVLISRNGPHENRLHQPLSADAGCQLLQRAFVHARAWLVAAAAQLRHAQRAGRIDRK